MTFFAPLVQLFAEHGLLFSLMVSIITLGVYGHLIFVQSIETVTIRDFLSKYRAYILTFLVISFLTLIPVTHYLMMRNIGIEDESLRNLATAAGRIGPLAQAIAFEVIFFYRKKKGE